jgi:hypothetical protein
MTISQSLLDLIRGKLGAFLRSLGIDPEPTPPENKPPAAPQERAASDAQANHFPLLQWSKEDEFTVGNAFEGVHIFGGNGSGKTTGPGSALLKSYFRHGFGALVLTAKGDECALIRRYAAETGRAKDLVVFSPEEPWRFNFLKYEQSRPARGAGLTENIVSLFTTVQESFERGDGGGAQQERYWKNALAQLVRNAVDLVLLSGETLSIPLMHDIVTSAPVSLDQLNSPAWQGGSRTYQLLDRLTQQEGLSARDRSTLSIVGKFWLSEFPTLPHDTRGSILSTFTTTADVFVRGTIGELFSTGLNIVPEVTFEGAILVIDLPVKAFGQVGLAAQVLWKYIWQQAVERRDTSRNARPVALWVDEAHLFVNEHDVHFQTTARSARCATTFLSQTLPNYYWAIGGEQKGQALTDSLMGVLQTKVFCANSDPRTNQWAADVIGKGFQSRFNSNINRNEEGHGAVSSGASESLEYLVQPSEFLTLKKGGPANDYLVEAYVLGGGRVFNASGSTYLKTAFKQG